MKWEARYVFVHDYTVHDELILLLGAYLEGLVHEGKLQKWFYIRYWEGGPHIRLRWMPSSEYDLNEQFCEAIRHFFVDHSTIPQLSKEKYYQNHKFDGVPRTLDSLPWHAHGEILAADYEPEYDRYGGQELMPLTEHLFMISSKYATAVIEATRGNSLSTRFIYALAIVKRLTHKVWEQLMPKIALEEFYQNCMQSWVQLYSITDLQYAETLLNHCRRQVAAIQKIVARLAVDATYLEFQDGLLEGLTQIADAIKDDKRFRSILYSHLHMFFNRIGIVPEYECAVYYLLKELGGELRVEGSFFEQTGAI
jgi:hypothetical protein